MEIKLAKMAGFCMGVRRAVDMALYIAKHKGDEEVYTYGPLIHNPQTIELLKERGIRPVEEIELTGRGTIIIRAHGISPSETQRLREKGIRIIDATCPKVVHVQSIIRRHATENYSILIIGDRDHPEVEGLMGHTFGQGIIIGGLDEVDRLPDMEKVCVVAQTTQSKDEYAKISERIRQRFPGALIFDTICDSTEKRQSEIKKMAGEMDAVIIIGGRNSANTRRLAKISESCGIPTFHIERVDDLKKIDVSGFGKIGISAGASTPNWVIRQIVTAIVRSED
ncbi:MAG: 4-hydroxy-3-methylbut-2-enyl diphosphate reductase [Syntrophales bacterium]|nr:4-hydroxy-3-methylbut-2-enyl diphosphate reductase [Syntrophales bacterium]MDD5532545.1 4-hydroxy-3-methylbut-2-enyl diphosphate reductase [Syntrophales bacterium]